MKSLFVLAYPPLPEFVPGMKEIRSQLTKENTDENGNKRRVLGYTIPETEAANGHVVLSKGKLQHTWQVMELCRVARKYKHLYTTDSIRATVRLLDYHVFDEHFLRIVTPFSFIGAPLYGLQGKSERLKYTSCGYEIYYIKNLFTGHTMWYGFKYTVLGSAITADLGTQEIMLFQYEGPVPSASTLKNCSVSQDGFMDIALRAQQLLDRYKENQKPFEPASAVADVVNK